MLPTVLPRVPPRYVPECHKDRTDADDHVPLSSRVQMLAPSGTALLVLKFAVLTARSTLNE